METWQTLSFILDGATLVLTAGMFFARPRIGGALGRGIYILTFGLVLVGVAFVAETSLFALTGSNLPTNEVLHRLMATLGLGVVIWGFGAMRRALQELG